MREIHMHFAGPFSFTPGPRCLFESPLRDSPCVYLWTIQSERDRQYYIHYVGEALSFAARQRRHLISMLGLEYGVFNPVAARQGVQKPLWPGLWRERGPTGIARALERYVSGALDVVEYIAAWDVFVAKVEGDATLRKGIEGAIAADLRSHPEFAVLYPGDNRVGAIAGMTPIRIEFSAGAPIVGLPSVLDL